MSLYIPGFLISASTYNTRLPSPAIDTARLIEVEDFPSFGTQLVRQMVLTALSVLQNCMLVLSVLMASSTASQSLLFIITLSLICFSPYPPHLSGCCLSHSVPAMFLHPRMFLFSYSGNPTV